MTIVSEVRDGVAIIKLSGNLAFDVSLYTLRPKIRDLLQSGVRYFVFDLANIGHCDSSGCGEMIGAYTTILKGDGKVAFASLSTRVQTLWERIKVTTIFNIFVTVQEGLDSLSQPR